MTLSEPPAPPETLVSGRFGCRMHSVLRNFVDTARRRFLMESEQLIERPGALADAITLLDRFEDVSFR